MASNNDIWELSEDDDSIAEESSSEEVIENYHKSNLGFPSCQQDVQAFIDEKYSLTEKIEEFSSEIDYRQENKEFQNDVTPKRDAIKHNTTENSVIWDEEIHEEEIFEISDREFKRIDSAENIGFQNLKQMNLDKFLGLKRIKSGNVVQRSILAYISNSNGLINEDKTEEPKLNVESSVSHDFDKTKKKRWKRKRWQEREDDKQPCPFYKKIPGTQFTVDAFKYGEIPGFKAHFLTHFHSDHYGGLNKRWTHGPIFCTVVTARLVNLCLGVDWKWLRPVKVGSTIKILGVQVTFLPANHCPGSALILFQLPCGKVILHTGDFRASKEMENFPHLVGISVDTVYLDTTYCNPRYCFPLQEEVSEFVIALAQRHLERNGKTLLAVGSYNVGKERIFLALAEALNVKIFVDRRRMRMLTCMDWPELTSRLTVNPQLTPLHILPLGAMHPPKLKSYLAQFKSQWNCILGIKPTGWTYSEKIGSNLERIRPQVAGNITVFGVPYSEHSSFTELRDFIQFLKPRQIIPTVNIGRAIEREAMQKHFRQWLSKV